MMLIDGTAIDLINEKEVTPPAYVMKFDPSKKTMGRASDNLHLKASASKTNAFEVMEIVVYNETVRHVGPESLVADWAISVGTAVDQRQLWPVLPKYFDYVEVESHYDADEIESLILQKSRSQGW